ncbi:glycosyltransferase family A protein [Acinetobacter rathckeae]|uniref:glycosyltransferase family A protein n=1 Tax=Acinetobacter rathckeae TaxID=2605272 RepID=UPI0018A2C5AE|nr:glycosyltransferase [Acinetobacter rathckeae]MBF7696213.1 glycosyltransferase [Acinetobacter rathckeae]
MKLSFCTTCKGRLWQLKKTIAHNIKQLDDDCEMVLLDYKSTDGLKDYIFSEYLDQLKTGKLKYFEMLEEYAYSSSYAKNVVHRLASGNILFNLDADNFIYDGLVSELKMLTEDQLFLPRLTGNDEGCYGRIGYSMKAFHRLNGYNETIIGMKADDGDLRKRAIPLRLIPIHAKQSTVAIQNTRQQKDVYTNDNPKNTLINPPLRMINEWGYAEVLDWQGRKFFTV